MIKSIQYDAASKDIEIVDIQDVDNPVIEEVVLPTLEERIIAMEDIIMEILI